MAKRFLRAGTSVFERDVESAGRSAGDILKIRVRTGSLIVETQGRRIACGGGRICAVLPSGRHVEGRLEDGHRLVVELP